MAKRKSKRAKELTTNDLESSITDSLLDAINKESRKELGVDTAYVLGQHESPADIKDWISTGSDILDLAIANRPDGGYPLGRIVELTGLEGSGKSLLAAHALASTQKKGGLAVYIDTENAISRQFLQAIGVNIDELLYIQMDNLEDIFLAVETIIEKVRTSNKDRIVTIVLDSVMAASTKIELESNFDKDGYATQKAIILSKAMRKITNLIGREKILFIATNQLRVRMGISFGDKYGTSGGKALAFHASVRLRTAATGKIKAKINGVEQVIGMRTKVEVKKNRLGPPHKKVDYDIYFDSGIDNYGGWLHELKKFKIVTQQGAWYSYDEVEKETGEILDTHKFQSKDFNSLMETNPELKSKLYEEICDNYIMAYKPGEEWGIDDITITDINDDPFADDPVESKNESKS